MITRRGFLRLIGGSFLSMVSLSAYAVGIEPMLLTHVKRYFLTPPHWPADLKLRVVVLADIHACRPWMTPERIASLAEEANELKPDVIVMLGDFPAGTRLVSDWVDASEWAPALSGLKAPLGVWSILGNHDWWEDRAAQAAGAGPTISRKALERVGIPVLENDVVRLEKDGHGFWLAGLADQLALRPGRAWGRTDFKGLDDLDGTLAKVSDNAPIILLAHEPDIFPKVPWRVSLTLSGHTHGGQVRLFGYSPVVPSAYGNRFAYGHVVENDRNLIVSGGLGFSIMPVRFGMRPEILQIDLG
ncbi:metallophosphoesterase [Mesorhizobium sp. M4B.F.Ca.ET.215.01.1.1]|uniref:metallophosphoesterase n=1 Tax=unclassified Mesorhizobium TaxID=325217 RepID=UPI000FCC2887|nr:MULTISPECIES: metallophosphoesterase [unclassified Mesorhizobium]RVC48024.1 metallophosphoesterase [Mesorhizobium sp. M4B.F.Ca.ET.088.02.2.1]RUW20554.1 metallophosphoesterase [Mesorhizobium sp. M4B.F.Ca.ET.013.02.1.1]RVD37234.1 metallophosphoesterase [Mesorhizobium sp. M4B.F.Ca.ET.019.03.1.1]RWA64878.1 MAG: metallophosphoesterase [Mesorhizobium sp.]RWF32610.1 MAG: metallophosphoesterase [Mesorhizobium sp.]